MGAGRDENLLGLASPLLNYFSNLIISEINLKNSQAILQNLAILSSRSILPPI